MGDFNFDSTEDLAIRSEDGIAGTYYRFYVQGKDHWFRLDPFLTDSMQIVPTRIDRVRRRLTTYQHAGAGYDGEQVYQLDARTNKWSLIRHRFIKLLSG